MQASQDAFAVAQAELGLVVAKIRRACAVPPGYLVKINGPEDWEWVDPQTAQAGPGAPMPRPSPLPTPEFARHHKSNGNGKAARK